MAGIDSQKQLLTLIRDVAAEKSQRERRIFDLKKRIQELRTELEATNAELASAKLLKESTEQELKGHEVELAMNEVWIQTLEARISLTQNEITTGGSELEALKNEEGALRDDFINRMLELNTMIRKFQDTVVSAFHKYNGYESAYMGDSEVRKSALENMLAQIISQTSIEEQEFQAEQITHKLAQQELIDLEKQVSLAEAIMKESRELQELTMQSSKFEDTCASLGDELQRRCLCPRCHLDNVEALGEFLQASDGS